MVPDIHRLPASKDSTNNCSELELIHAFVIQLKDSISKELVSREFNYTSLQSLIEAAQRFEEHKDPIIQDKPVSNWTPDVLFSGRGPSRPTPLNGLVKSSAKGHLRGKLPSNSASGKSGGKGPFSGSSKDNSFSFKVQMKCFFIAEFERAAKIRKIAVYRFLISLLVPEL